VAVAGGEPRQVTRSMGRIDPARLPVPEEVTFLAPDNLPIPTMIIRPAGFRADGRYPVLVRLHGHPGQWNHGFEVMDQYFADRGYIVIKPNPRGSRGFGQGFHDLHIADYGGAEFQDVMAVIPYLRSLGYADMDRLVTEGGSGGGYMSFVIATEAPTAFRAQAIRAPVSDWGLIAIDRFAASGGRGPLRGSPGGSGRSSAVPGGDPRRVPPPLPHPLRGERGGAPVAHAWAPGQRGAPPAVHGLGGPDAGTGEGLPHHLRGVPGRGPLPAPVQDTTRDRLQRMERFWSTSPAPVR
jgi:acetyl esterase/lipase